MKLWDKLLELMAVREEIDSANAIDFIEDCCEFLDPNNVEEELSDRQRDWIGSLFEKHCNDDEEAFDEWD